MIVGNEIDGLAASVKEFVKNQDRYINSEEVFLINDENEEALKVYDYMHNNANKNNYKKRRAGFG